MLPMETQVEANKDAKVQIEEEKGDEENGSLSSSLGLIRVIQVQLEIEEEK